MNPPLPHFRYHPEPLASSSIEASATTCQCCGKARGYVYTGSPYSRHELPPGSLCPWCIADGSAAARYEASFSDDYPLLDAGVAADIVTEV
ncbi:CbrC family protein, partial [Pseudomonas aeruginosa]